MTAGDHHRVTCLFLIIQTTLCGHHKWSHGIWHGPFFRLFPSFLFFSFLFFLFSFFSFLNTLYAIGWRWLSQVLWLCRIEKLDAWTLHHSGCEAASFLVYLTHSDPISRANRATLIRRSIKYISSLEERIMHSYNSLVVTQRPFNILRLPHQEKNLLIYINRKEEMKMFIY